jgi:heme A synthase
MKLLPVVALAMLVLAGSSSAKLRHGWKGEVHLAAVPFIAATGIYSDVRILQTADRDFTKAGAITNLALLGIQASLGTTILFGSDDQPQVIRLIHHFVGAAVVASAFWISIQGARDPGVPNLTRNISYAHTVLASAPLLLFSF